MKPKTGSLTMKEMRLRLSPHKSDTSTANNDPFGQLEESDTEEASMYQEPVRLEVVGGFLIAAVVGRLNSGVEPNLVER